MRRNSVFALANNADATALETARAALGASDGRAVLAKGSVGLTIAAAAGEQLVSGDMIGFALMPTVVKADRSISAFEWHRWPGGDFAIVQGAKLMVVGPKDVPPGATSVICLPLAVVDSAGTTTFNCGVFFEAAGTVG